MIDLTKPVTIQKPGSDVVHLSETAQLITYGRILLVRKDHCVVLVSAGPNAGKKVQMPLTFPATIDGVTYCVNAPVASEQEAPVEKVKRVKAAPGETKMDKCKVIFAAHRDAPKADVIKMFIEQAGCTPAGANTYFLTCKKTV